MARQGGLHGGGGSSNTSGGGSGGGRRRRRMLLLLAAASTTVLAIVLIAVLVPALRSRNLRHSTALESARGPAPPASGQGEGGAIAPSAGAVAGGVAGPVAGLGADGGGPTPDAAAPPHGSAGPSHRPGTAGNISQAFTHVTPDLQLERDCRRVVLVGFNAYDLASMALVTPKAFRTLGGRSGREAMGEAFRAAARRGLNVVRAWAHSSDPEFPFQVAPGLYLEAALEGLDWVVANAGAAGLQLVLSLVDNWKYYNGMDQYVDWSPTAPPRTRPRPPDMPGDPDGIGARRTGAPPESDGVIRVAGGNVSRGPTAAAAAGADPAYLYEVRRHSLFFSDPGARALYRSHAATIINRRNTFTGRLYRDEPAIMAWDLANEPRCETWANPDCNRILQDWVLEMSNHVRMLDPNHLITIGSEGFFGPSTPELQRYNPGDWASGLGQDFVANNAAPNIDFATVHLWPDNWESGTSYPEFLNRWLTSHLQAAISTLRKPVLLEEFGKKVALVPGPTARPPPAAARPSDPRVVPAAAAGAGAGVGTGGGAGAGGVGALPIRDPAALAARDAVYQVTYEQVSKALFPPPPPSSAGRAPASPLVGSLFWSWQLQVFADALPDAYGVMLGDRALELAAAHAAAVARLTGGPNAPRRRDCACSCWAPVLRPAATASSNIAGGPGVPLQPACTSLWEACGLTWQPGGLLDGWEELERAATSNDVSAADELGPVGILTALGDLPLAPMVGSQERVTAAAEGGGAAAGLAQSAPPAAVAGGCMGAFLRTLLPATLFPLAAAAAATGQPVVTAAAGDAEASPGAKPAAGRAVPRVRGNANIGHGSMLPTPCAAALWQPLKAQLLLELGGAAGGANAATGKNVSSPSVTAKCAVLWAHELCNISSVAALFARRTSADAAVAWDGVSAPLTRALGTARTPAQRDASSGASSGATGIDAPLQGQRPAPGVLGLAAGSAGVRVQPPRMLRVYGSEGECCAAAEAGGAFPAGCA